MLWREPNVLWLLAAVIALAVAGARWLARRAASMRAFAEAGLLERLTPDVDRRRRAWRLALRVAALAVIVVAIAGPRWGFQWQKVEREGIDLIVAIDTSRSMLTEDVKPNRLERAKLAVLDLLKLLQGDRIGLVAFAGTAFLECPLTLDYSAFERSLHSIDVGIIPRGGTALERAIDASLGGFEARQGKHEALILITDGEDHEGDAEAAAKRAMEAGVKVFTVGIGTSEGELVPASAGGQGFVKDRKGQVVKSRLDEDTLQKIALATGGAYVHGAGASLGIDEVFNDHIAKMEKRDVASTLERRYEDRFQFPLALAIAFLLVEGWIGDRRPRRSSERGRWWRRFTALRPSRAARATTGKAALLLFVLLPTLVGWLDPRGNAAAEGNQLYDQGKYDDAVKKYGDGLVDEPDSRLLQFNLGTALLKQGKIDDAIASLSKVAASGAEQWVGPAAYNLGNALYRKGADQETGDPQSAVGSWEQALAAYKRAMGAAPKDEDAKFNHELVTRKLDALKKRIEEERQKKEQEKQDEEKKKQEQQQESKDQQQDQQQPQDQQQKDEQQQDQQRQDQQQQQADQDQQQQPQDQGQNGDQQKQQEEQSQQAAQDQQQQRQQADDQQQAKQDEQQDQAGQGAQQPEEQHAAQKDSAQQGGAAAAGGEEQRSPQQQAAQAVLDLARDEELGPDDVHPKVGIAGLGEPSQDW